MILNPPPFLDMKIAVCKISWDILFQKTKAFVDLWRGDEDLFLSLLLSKSIAFTSLFWSWYGIWIPDASKNFSTRKTGYLLLAFFPSPNTTFIFESAHFHIDNLTLKEQLALWCPRQWHLPCGKPPPNWFFFFFFFSIDYDISYFCDLSWAFDMVFLIVFSVLCNLLFTFQK